MKLNLNYFNFKLITDAQRVMRGTLPFSEDTSEHGSLFATSAFRGLKEAIPDSSTSTFAYCRFGLASPINMCGINEFVADLYGLADAASDLILFELVGAVA